MKDTLNFLKQLCKKEAFDPNYYYIIRFYSNKLLFQGRYCSGLATKLKKQGISLKLDTKSNFIIGDKTDKKTGVKITIALT